MISAKRALRTAVVLFSAYTVSQAYIATLLHPLGRDVLRVQTTGDPNELQRIMASWTAEQRLQYRKHLLPDMLHPLLYASALAAAGIAGHEPSTPRWVRIVAIATPVVSAACDLSENALHARFVNQPDRTTRAAARASTVLTRTKWVLACGTTGALIARTLRKRMSTR